VSLPRDPVILVASEDGDDNHRMAEAVRREHPRLTVNEATTLDEVRSHIGDASILFASRLANPALAEGKKLTWFQTMSAGVERVIDAPKPPQPIMVTNLKGVFGSAMAEYAVAYMLAHTQRIRRVVRAQNDREWSRFTPDLLEGQTAGIAGLGSIGRVVARRCVGLGLHVIGLKRERGDVSEVETTYSVDEIERFLPQCDFLVLVLPQTPETAGLLTPARLRLLRPHCFLINIGRGTVVREEDLIEALQTGVLAGAALDVFQREPLRPESPLWGIESVYITPHISGVNRPEQIVGVFLENLDHYLRGDALLNQVDFSRQY